MINDRRDPVVGADSQKFRPKLLAGADVDGNDGVGKPEFLQHDRDFPAVRRRRIVQVDHGSLDPSPRVYSPVTATFVVLLYADHKTWQTGAQSEPTGRLSCCFQPRSQAPCRSRNGWPSPTRCGRPGSPKATNSPAPSAMRPCSR